MEFAFDGLVGPTHQYAGLSLGNLASAHHAGQVGNPRAAALQGLTKMRLVAELTGAQAVLPPHERPHLGFLRSIGFSGSDEQVLARAVLDAPELLRTASSASAMWAANAATVTPSSDTEDGRLHLTPANLSAMLHRSLEAPTTTRVLRQIFSDTTCAAVHEALPAHASFSDEGAANHTRLFTSQACVHLFGWGHAPGVSKPTRFPARQARAASVAIARRHGLNQRALFVQQDPAGIDAGAFHTDVLAVGAERLLLIHERAFVDMERVLIDLRRDLGEELCVRHVSEQELSVSEAVRCYPFNSEIVPLAAGGLAVLAPEETQTSEAARRVLDGLPEICSDVRRIIYVNVNDSMRNGGGPACLRLRIPLNDRERASVKASVFFDDELDRKLVTWVERHYRDRLTPSDLADPALLRETRTALDELTGLLGLGSVYDFQR